MVSLLLAHVSKRSTAFIAGSSTAVRTRSCATRNMSSTTNTAVSPTELMQHALHRVRQVNQMPERLVVIPFYVENMVLGKVTHDKAQKLVESSSDFRLQDNKLVLQCESTVEARTTAVAKVMDQWRQEGIVTGWRDELYSVQSSFYEEPVFLMERAAVPHLGVLEYGVHMNGIVTNDNGQVQMWMARRSATKSKYPGMLDHIVAGGQPAGLSLLDNAVKECMEEAGIPEEMARSGLQATGAVSYETYSPKHDTITRAVLFNYDLELPTSFVPVPQDGEVQEFFLWTIDDMFRSMAPDFKDPIKPNCYSVIIDFLLRKGYLSPDVPGYLDVVRELRSGDCK